MDTTKTCQHCGKPIGPEAAGGLCPQCMMKVGLGSEAGSDTKPPGPEGRRRIAFVPPTVAELAKYFPQLEVIELLGQGGMGAVYKARQPALDRLVALKILSPQTAGDAGFAERFTREARALARLSHPNIVAVYEFGRVDGLHYFLMEYVDGPNLRQIEQGGELTPTQALQLIPQICGALQFAHDEGIVHRDIKPENVLVDKKGRVKIADFGLAKILGLEPKDLRLTGAKDVMGTPVYMAPEQIERPREVDHRADIYSLGVVFYEMLTGELPLGKFGPPSSRMRGIHVDVRLDEVVLHTLEKEPERRYQHASEVKTDVESIAEKGPPALAQRRAAWQVPAMVAAAVLLLLMLAILVPNLVPRRSKAHEPAGAGVSRALTGSTPADWLKEAGVDLDKVDIKTAPMTQVSIEDLQPDGTSRFHSVIREVVEGDRPLQQLQFINSDFVDLQKIVDANGNDVPFTSTHYGQHYNYTATLASPASPGSVLIYGSKGVMRNKVDQDPGQNTFTYHFEHSPNAGVPVRRVEVHRLPAGAELLEMSPGVARRESAGRIEVVLDKMIRPGGSVSLSYRY